MDGDRPVGGRCRFLGPARARPTAAGPAPLTPLAFAAAATTRLEVGTWVPANDFRNPVVVAREAATLDLLSGGRFRLGLGAGPPANGYGDLGVTVESGAIRVERLAESVRIVNALFRGERVHLTGTHYASAGAELLPPPRRKVPLLIAAGGRRATELAAAEADTVAFSTFSRTQLARQLEWLENAAGERFPRLELALRFSAPSSTIGPPMPDEEPNLLAGAPDEVADQLRRMGRDQPRGGRRAPAWTDSNGGRERRGGRRWRADGVRSRHLLRRPGPGLGPGPGQTGLNHRKRRHGPRAQRHRDIGPSLPGSSALASARSGGQAVCCVTPSLPPAPA